MQKRVVNLCSSRRTPCRTLPYPDCTCTNHAKPHVKLKGLRPLPPTPADSRIFGFFDFSENVDFEDFPVGFGVWEGLQWIGNGCGLQMDGFSAHFEPSESISVDFHYLCYFACVCTLGGPNHYKNLQTIMAANNYTIKAMVFF